VKDGQGAATDNDRKAPRPHPRNAKKAAAALHEAANLFRRPLSCANSTSGRVSTVTGPPYPADPRNSPVASTCAARYQK